jgi:hypothetical protein
LNPGTRYFVRSADGRSIASYGDHKAAERAALSLGEGSHVVDTQAPVYVPMIEQVADGELRILGVGGWGADRLSPQQNFLQAIKRKQLAIVHAFLAAGADPDTRDDRGRPAIVWAVASGRPEILQFLLEQGADPDVADPNGTTALGLAAERGASGMITILEGFPGGRQGSP